MKKFFVTDDNSYKEDKEGMVKKDGLYVPKELSDKKDEALKKSEDSNV